MSCTCSNGIQLACMRGRSGFETLALSACSKTTMLSACKGKRLDPQGSDLRHILPLKLGYSGAEGGGGGGGERQEVLL